MNTVSHFIVAMGAAGLLAVTPALAQEEDDEAADLQSYSVGSPRPQIEPQKITIERPKFNNDFKIELSRPTPDGIKLARPSLEVLPTPEPQRPAAAQAEAAGGASASVATGESRPVRPLRMDPPDYPRDAYRRRQEGFVIVEFTINAQGGTEDIAVVEAEPRGAFENEARRAVGRWTFEPALRDGRPVPQRIRHTLEFKLNR